MLIYNKTITRYKTVIQKIWGVVAVRSSVESF